MENSTVNAPHTRPLTMPTAEDDYNRDEIIEMTPAQDPMAALAQLAGLAPAAPQPANGFREIAARQDIGMLPHADPRALEPGDILFGRGSKPISLVISLLNGYWSHSAIYYGCLLYTSPSPRDS